MKHTFRHLAFSLLFFFFALAQTWACPNVGLTATNPSGLNCTDGAIHVEVYQTEPKTWRIVIFNIATQAYIGETTGGQGSTNVTFPNLGFGSYRGEIYEGEATCGGVSIALNASCSGISATPVITQVSGRGCTDGTITIAAPAQFCLPSTLQLTRQNPITGIYVPVSSVTLAPGESHTFNGLSAGAYTCAFAENGNNGCLYSVGAFIPQPNCQMSLQTTATQLSSRNCSDGTITVTPTGYCQPGKLTISRQNTFTNLFQTIGTVTVAAGASHTFTGLGAGVYSFSFSDDSPFSCLSSATRTIVLPGCQLSLPYAATPVSGRNCSDASVTLTPTGNCLPGQLTLQKRNVFSNVFENVETVTVAAGASHTFAGLSAGVYQFQFSEDGLFGCLATNSATIVLPACQQTLPVTSTPVSDRNCLDGSLSITPTGNCLPGKVTFYKIDNNVFRVRGIFDIPVGQSRTFSNLEAGQYSFTFAEAGDYGCLTTSAANVSMPGTYNANPNLTATAPSGANCLDGSLTTAPTSICQPGSVSFYRKNAQGFYIFVENKAVAPGGTATLNGLPAGEYLGRLAENGTFGSIVSQTKIVGAPACNLNLNPVVTNLTKRNCGNGSIKIAPSGACQNWTATLLLDSYPLDTLTGTPSSTATFSGLAAGDYQIQFDENGLHGCDTLQNVSVAQPDCSTLSMTITIQKQPKLGCSDGKARIKANGICGQFTVTLVDAANYVFYGTFDGTFWNFINLPAGTYAATLTETTPGGCVVTAPLVLTSVCSMTQTLSTVAAPGGCPGWLRSKVVGLNCSSTANVVWTNTANGETGNLELNDNTNFYEANLPAGTYTVAANYGQCTVNGTATIAAGACNLGLTATVQNSGFCGASTITAGTMTCDSVLFELLDWENTLVQSFTIPGGQTGTFDNLSTGIYTVRATRGNCVSTLSRTLACPKPGYGYANPLSPTSVHLTWDSLPCAEFGYTVQYRLYSASTWTTVNINGNTPSKTLQNLQPNSEYVWRVRAKCASNLVSLYTSNFIFTTPGSRPTSASQNRQAKVFGKNATSGLPQIFPNPVRNQLEIQWKTARTEQVEIQIFDEKGTMVLSKSAAPANGQLAETLNVAALAPGAYFVQLADGQTKTAPQKILKAD